MEHMEPPERPIALLLIPGEIDEPNLRILLPRGVKL